MAPMLFSKLVFNLNVAALCVLLLSAPAQAASIEADRVDCDPTLWKSLGCDSGSYQTEVYDFPWAAHGWDDFGFSQPAVSIHSNWALMLVKKSTLLGRFSNLHALPVVYQNQRSRQKQSDLFFQADSYRIMSIQDGYAVILMHSKYITQYLMPVNLFNRYLSANRTLNTMVHMAGPVWKEIHKSCDGNGDGFARCHMDPVRSKSAAELTSSIDAPYIYARCLHDNEPPLPGGPRGLNYLISQEGSGDDLLAGIDVRDHVRASSCLPSNQFFNLARTDIQDFVISVGGIDFRSTWRWTEPDKDKDVAIGYYRANGHERLLYKTMPLIRRAVKAEKKSDSIRSGFCRARIPSGWAGGIVQNGFGCMRPTPSGEIIYHSEYEVLAGNPELRSEDYDPAAPYFDKEGGQPYYPTPYADEESSAELPVKVLAAEYQWQNIRSYKDGDLLFSAETVNPAEPVTELNEVYCRVRMTDGSFEAGVVSSVLMDSRCGVIVTKNLSKADSIDGEAKGNGNGPTPAGLMTTDLMFFDDYEVLVQRKTRSPLSPSTSPSTSAIPTTTLSTPDHEAVSSRPSGTRKYYKPEEDTTTLMQGWIVFVTLLGIYYAYGQVSY